MRILIALVNSALVNSALVIAALVAGGCAPADDPPAAEAPPRPVRVAWVEHASVAESLRLPGVTRAVKRARPAFLHAGYLAERHVAPGHAVAAGEMLATLHNPALSPRVNAAAAAVREARERYEQLKRDAERLQRLAGRNLVSDDELDQTRSRRNAAGEALARAEANLDEAREQLAEASLRAPFAGVVSDVFVEPGDFVAAGQPVLELVDPDRLEVLLHLPAGRAAGLAVGSPVRIVGPAGDATATVREIGRSGPGQPGPVVVELDDPGRRQPGEPVQVIVEFPAQSVLSVPLAAVVNPGSGASRVVRISDGRAEHVEVELGRLEAGRIAIRGRLEAGDRVVVAGQAQLLDGEAVRVLP